MTLPCTITVREIDTGKIVFSTTPIDSYFHALATWRSLLTLHVAAALSVVDATGCDITCEIDALVSRAEEFFAPAEKEMF